LRQVNSDVLATADQLTRTAIEAVLAKSDLELGLEALLRGWQEPRIGLLGDALHDHPVARFGERDKLGRLRREHHRVRSRPRPGPRRAASTTTTTIRVWPSSR
jgi:hypothetical protein